MLFQLLLTVFLNLVRPCEGSLSFQGTPTFQEEYRGSYVPSFIDTELGLQVVAPDTPYVAAAGPDQLYFIDTRFDTEAASHIKEQIERASVPNPDENKEARDQRDDFVFDPPYARVMFAEGMNRRNPALGLPVHEPAGEWLVTYGLGDTLKKKKKYFCYEFGCYGPSDCVRQTRGNCRSCKKGRVDNMCEPGPVNGIGICRPLCNIAVDTPREVGETDAEYYQRMEELHWGAETGGDADQGTAV